MICSLNDILDNKLLEMDSLVKREQVFRPEDCFNGLISMLANQVAVKLYIIQSPLSAKSHSLLNSENQEELNA